MKKFIHVTREAILWITIPLVGLSLVIAAFLWVFRTPAPHTAPTPVEIQAPSSVRLFVIGDSGSGKDGQHRVAAAMEARCQEVGRIDALLIAGDVIYDDGAISPSDPQWESKGIGPYRLPCLSKAPIIAVLGNHDYKGDPSAYLLKGAQEPRWIMPARNFDVRFGDLLHLVALDSNRPDWCGLSSRCMWDFAKARLDSAKSRWRFVLAHHFLDASGAHHPSAGFYGFFGKRYLCSHFDAFLAGHAHHLEHLRPRDCGEHFVSGGGGGGLQGIHQPRSSSSIFAENVNGFLEASVSPERVDWSFFSPDRGVIYRTATLKPSARHPR
jgi:acid phosphatase